MGVRVGDGGVMPQVLQLIFLSFLCCWAKRCRGRGRGSGGRNNGTGSWAGRWSWLREAIRGEGSEISWLFLCHPALKSWTGPSRIHFHEGTLGSAGWLWSKEKASIKKTVLYNRWRWWWGLEPGDSAHPMKTLAAKAQVARGGRTKGWAEHRGLDVNEGTS